jgi:hypothetical protein
VDDAYIYLRAIDGPPLGGNALASYLWATLGVFGIYGYKVAGVLCALALVRMMRDEAGLAGACLLACYPGVWICSVAGLETMAAAAALFGVYRFRARPGVAMTCAILCGLFRLEVGAVAVVLLALRWPGWAFAAGGILVLYAVTVHALAGPYAPAVYKLSEGHSGVGSTVKAMVALAAILALPALLHARRLPGLMHRTAWIAVGLFLVGIAVPRHLTDFGWRFTLPIVPLVIALLAPVLRPRWAVLAAMVVAVSISWADVRYAERFARFNADLKAIGEELRHEGVGRIAVAWAGIVPWESRAETLDLLGYTSTGRPPTWVELLAFEPDRIFLHAPGERPAWETFVRSESKYQRALEAHGWKMGRSWLLADGRELVEWARP